MDPKIEATTNLMMRKGRQWGARDIAIPVASIDFTDGSTVYIKIDKAAVKALPAAKVQRK